MNIQNRVIHEYLNKLIQENVKKKDKHNPERLIQERFKTEVQ